MNPNSSNRPDFAPHVEDQWQMDCSTVGDSVAHFFLNDFRADVYFVPLRNASNPPRKFPGHKLILLGRSTVLSAQFHYDQNQQQGNDKINKTANNQENEIQEIELPDVEPDIFEEFLRFCYTDRAEINMENAAPILLIANHYCVPALEKLATDFICENMDAENVFDILQFANQYNFTGAEKIKGLALLFLCNSPEAVRTEAFLRISAETLELFAGQDNIQMREIELFIALIRWAKKQLKIAGNEQKSLRELLGPALFQVQFWKMDIQHFGEYVVPRNVLTDAETLYVFKKLSVSYRYNFFQDPDCPFPVSKVVNRGCQSIHFDIQDAQNIFAAEPYAVSHEIYLQSHWFRILGKITQNIHDQNKKDVSFFLLCRGDRPNWGCSAFAELILVSKTPEKENIVLKIAHRFCPRQHNCGVPAFIPLDDLLDPEKGWILDDTVTLKARVYVVDN